MERVRFWIVVLSFCAIAAGAFQPFYLKVWQHDRGVLRRSLAATPYRQVPGLRRACENADLRTPLGAQILLVTPSQQWNGAYDYTFRRAQYLLAGKTLLPNVPTDPPDRLGPPTHVLCIPGCSVPPDFAVTWRGSEGMLLERRR